MAAVVAPLVVLPLPPDASDNGALLCLCLIPAFILPFIIVGACSCMDGECIVNSSDTARFRQGFTFFVGAMLGFFAVALATVHTEREDIFDYYTQIAVPNWQRPPQQAQALFQNLSTFYITPSYSLATTPARVYFTPRTIPVVPTGYTEGVPTNVDSVVQEVSLSRALFANFSGEALLNSLIVGGYVEQTTIALGSSETPTGSMGSASSSSSSSAYRAGQAIAYWDRTLFESLVCHNDDDNDPHNPSGFCTQRCQYSYSFACSITQSGKFAAYCRSKGGRWYSSVSGNATTCTAYSTCGFCAYDIYLKSLCFCVARTARYEWAVSNAKEPCGSFSSALCPPAVWVRNISEMPANVTVRLVSSEDPGLLLAAATGSNSYEFPVSTEAKYGRPGTIVGAVSAFILCSFFIMMLSDEEVACFAEGHCVRVFLATGRLPSSAASDGSGSDDSTAGLAAGLAGEKKPLNSKKQKGYGGGESDDDVNDGEKMLCQICFEYPRNTKFQCEHHLCCKTCALALKNSANPVCPLCRAPIQSVEDCPVDAPTNAAFRPSSSSGGDSDASLGSGMSSQDSNDCYRRSCMICMGAPRSTRFSCGHSACCAACAQMVLQSTRACPVCRLGVTRADPASTGEPTFVNLNAPRAAAAAAAKDRNKKKRERR